MPKSIERKPGLLNLTTQSELNQVVDQFLSAIDIK